MSGEARKSGTALRLARALLFAAGSAVIVLALMLGTLRLLLAQLPEYQAELKAWVDDSLGLTLDFDRLDVRLGLRGPELTFGNVVLAANRGDRPFLVADRAAIVVDPWVALTERELRLSRLIVDGTRLTVERLADGGLRLQGGPAGDARVDLALTLPPDIEVALTDSSVAYVDAQRGIEWEFADVTLGLRRRDDLLQLEATAEPPAYLATGVEFAAQQLSDGASPNWRVFGEIIGADIAAAAAALPSAAFVPSRGAGDLAVWLEWGPDGLTRGMVDADLTDPEWAAPSGRGTGAYERVAVSAEWQRLADGWRVLVDDMNVTRNGRTWPSAGASRLVVDGDRIELDSVFLRLDDLTPLVAALPPSGAAERWLELDPRGDVRDADIELERIDGGEWAYRVAAAFDRLGIEPSAGRPGFDGLTGELRADADSGRAELATAGATFEWPQLFGEPLDIDALEGLVVWREGFDAVRLVSDDLLLSTRDVSTRSNLELSLPLDGSSPELELETTIGPFAVTAAKRYLPARVMPPVAVAWLDNALVGGRVTGGRLELVGPLAAFPFDGDEGIFSVELDVRDGALEYVDGWPRAVDLDGTVEFRNAGFAARGSGRVLGNVADDVEVGIRDLRDAVLRVRTDTSGPLGDVLGFLKESPMIANYLGPGYERVEAPGGRGRVSLDLALPLGDMAAYELDASLGIDEGELAIDGFAPRASALSGTLTVAEGGVRAQGIEGVFLDGPVRVDVAPAEVDGYRARLEFGGEVNADAVARAFSLPIEPQVAGQTRWAGSLLIPSQREDGAAAAPLRVGVRSNLSGVALSFPEPFAKEPAAATTLQLDFSIGADRLGVDGHLGASRRFAAEFEGGDDGYVFRRGALRFGGLAPDSAPAGRLTVSGSLPVLDFDAWLDTARSMGVRAIGREVGDSIGGAALEADLDIADLSGFGQQLGGGTLSVHRGNGEWLIGVDTAPVAGSIAVPTGGAGRPAVVANMSRLHIEPGDGPGLTRLDPRGLPGLLLKADSFSYGQRRLDNLTADIRADALGLRLVSFESSSEAFVVDGSGGWFDGSDGATTRLAFNLRAADVAATLEQLGLDPIAEGGSAEVTASVYWPGPPSADWTQHLGGDVALRLGTGSLLDIDPGAGRVVGLMSISALPRRLALDFRDVFNKGFVFDEIAADFAIVDGNAYTDNLKVTGPVAEIGVAGRVGLRDRDYGQQAVVTAEPGKMLPTVGGLIGGPGVGAALLIFTRIFKEPLKGIGRASYCVTGTWEAPVVERLSAEQLEQGRLCAELPASAPTPEQAGRKVAGPR